MRFCVEAECLPKQQMGLLVQLLTLTFQTISYG